MIKIKTEDIYTLQQACESLAYQVAQYENPGHYDYSDEKIAIILRCEGLEVSIDD